MQLIVLLQIVQRKKAKDQKGKEGLEKLGRQGKEKNRGQRDIRKWLLGRKDGACMQEGGQRRNRMKPEQNCMTNKMLQFVIASANYVHCLHCYH